MKKISLVFVWMIASLFSFSTDGVNAVKANLGTVTVFRVGAEMNHKAKADI